MLFHVWPQKNPSSTVIQFRQLAQSKADLLFTLLKYMLHPLLTISNSIKCVAGIEHQIQAYEFVPRRANNCSIKLLEKSVCLLG